MKTAESSGHRSEAADQAGCVPPKKRRRGEGPPATSSSSGGAVAAAGVGGAGAFSLLSHAVADRFGRRMYLASQGGARAWVSADALPQRLVLEYATAGTVGGAPARCAHAPCARPLRHDAPSKYCSRACGLAAARRLLAARVAAHARRDDGADLRPPRPSSFTPSVECSRSAANPAAVDDGTTTTTTTITKGEKPVSWLADVQRERAALEAENARLAARLDACRAELDALRGAPRVACTDDDGDDSADSDALARKSSSGFYQCPLCLRALAPAAFVRHVASCYETVCKREHRFIFFSPLHFDSPFVIHHCHCQLLLQLPLPLRLLVHVF